MLEIFRLISAKLLEPIYFSLFLLIGKDLKKRRLLFVLIMIFEYILLKIYIKFDVGFQFLYTFMTFLIVKVLYKEKVQITDIFLFTVASIFLIISSFACYIIIYFLTKNYYLVLIVNRLIIFLFLFIFRKTIREKYVEFYSLWNRHNNPNKLKSLTLRNISIIIFNLMFWLINLGMIFTKIFGILLVVLWRNW